MVGGVVVGLVVGLGAFGAVGTVVGGGASCLPAESSPEAGSVPLAPAPGAPLATAAAQRAAAEFGAELAPLLPPSDGSAGAAPSDRLDTGPTTPDAGAAAATELAPADSVESALVSVVAANAARPLTKVAVTVIDAANADRLSMGDTS